MSGRTPLACLVALLVAWPAVAAPAGPLRLSAPLELDPRASALRAAVDLEPDDAGLSRVDAPLGEVAPPTRTAPAEPRRLTRWFTEPDDPETLQVPRFRLELSVRAAWLVDGRVKKGRSRDATTIDLHKDAHLPIVISPGARAVLDVKLHPNLAIGVHATGLSFAGPKRTLHGRRKVLQSEVFDSAVPTETLVDLQLAELFVRYVVRDNEQVRLAFGVGAAWGQLRLRMRSEQARARGRVSALFAPTIGYHFSVRAHPRVVVFLESVTAVIAPTRFPSYLSEFRVGLRFPLLAGVELIAAGSMWSAWLEDLRDIWGPRPTANHKEREAVWTVLGLELGMAWRF